MPQITVPSGETETLVEKHEEARTFHVRVTGESISLSQQEDARFASGGVTYPVGVSTWITLRPGKHLVADNSGSADATVEIDRQPAPDAVAQDPANSGTQTVTDDGSFALAGNQDVDIAEQSLAAVTVGDNGSFDVNDYKGSTVPVEQQSPVVAEADDGAGNVAQIHRVGNALLVNIDGQTTALNISDRAAREIGKARMQDSAGTLIDPRKQADYNVEYTSIDQNATGTTTVYDPANDAEVGAVHLDNPGSSAELRLEVTDGTNTAVLDDPAAGEAIHFTDDMYLDAGDSLQVVVETAEGSSQSATCAVSRGEL